MRFLRPALLFLAGVALVLACQPAAAKKDDKFCTPGKYVFCRCLDRQEGQKLCNSDALTFGKCEPCETFDNPEIPLEPGDPTSESPVITFDAGRPDAAKDPTPTGGPNCGNGSVDQGEDCDNQDTNDLDGCDQSCKLAGTTPPASNGCPGLDVHVWGGAHQPTLAIATTGAGNRSANPACAGTVTGATAPDRVFKVFAHKTGMLTVALTEATYDAFLYASDACNASQNTYLTCKNEKAGTGDESLTIAVTAGKSYWVFADGAASAPNQGDARITFSIP